MKNIIGVFKSSQILYDFKMFTHETLLKITPYEFISKLKRGEYDDFFFAKEHVIHPKENQVLLPFSKPTE